MPWASWRRPCRWFASSASSSGDRAAPAATQAFSALWQRRQRGLGGFAIGEFDEAATARTRQTRRSDPRQAPRTQPRRRVHGGAGPARTHCRAVHPKRSRILSRARHFASIQRLGTIRPWRRMNARIDQHIPGRRQVDRGQQFAHAFRPGVVPAHEHRHIGSERGRVRRARRWDSRMTPEAFAARPAPSRHRRIRRRNRRRPECAFRR